MRLIDADTLMEKVERIQPWDAYLGKYAQGIRHCMEIVSFLIKDAPTIESSAQPERKRGKWINKDGGLATCSACGERWGVWSVMNYCPNCGAHMEGETT